MKLTPLLEKLSTPTKICKICFRPIKDNNFLTIFDKNPLFCKECLDKLLPKFIEFKEQNINCLAIYDYDEIIQGTLYQIKGCYDIELSPIFLYRFKEELSIKYSGWIMVPIPSWIEDDIAREFNHVEEIFKGLNLRIIKCFSKTQKYKQSDQKKEHRNEIINILKMSHIEQIHNKKILLVDDVYTTGSTIRACIKLLKEAGAKKIQVLVIAKVKDKNNEK